MVERDLRRNGVGHNLLRAAQLMAVNKRLVFLHVPQEQKAMRALLKSAGMQNHLNQFEMIMGL